MMSRLITIVDKQSDISSNLDYSATVHLNIEPSITEFKSTKGSTYLMNLQLLDTNSTISLSNTKAFKNPYFGCMYVCFTNVGTDSISNTSTPITASEVSSHTGIKNKIKTKFEDIYSNAIVEQYYNIENILSISKPAILEEYKSNPVDSSDINKKLYLYNYDNTIFTNSINGNSIQSAKSALLSSNSIIWFTIDFKNMKLMLNTCSINKLGIKESDISVTTINVNRPDTAPSNTPTSPTKHLDGYFQAFEPTGWSDRKNKLGYIDKSVNSVFLHNGGDWYPAPLTGTGKRINT